MRKSRKNIIVILCICMLFFSGCKNAEPIDTVVQKDNQIQEQVLSNEEIEVKENFSDISNDRREEIGTEQEENTETEEIIGETQESMETEENVLSPLSLNGTKLVNESGETVQLRGISTHGIAWFPQYVNQEFFYELKEEWNANVVRLAMYTAEYDGYCNGGDKEKLKELVKNGVEYATNAGLYVIVDWHVLHDQNPQTHKEEAKLFFDEMSKEYKDYTNVIYEICNEPNGGTGWAEVKSYAEEIIPIIRANDEDAIIIVGTPTWCQDIDKAQADPISGYKNIMYAVHFYAASHTDWLREKVVNALNAGIPVFVSEFGTCDASGNGGIDVEQSDKWIELLNENDISFVAWNLSNKGETSAIFKTDCQKTFDFTKEDLTENGQWIYKTLYESKK